ncbi:polysaccharide deacetylase family sporulation protein PdaB [Paenibacillus sp. HN-1]|uniref:polysaccharide deacetylase family sporulation protein PdaB n=1 Tax=Paenibacillus TaxID=44249 RepID=UPI001CA9A809|nr:MULTISPECIES: polysaccharide deacetylase family sporulation protein PdaB [Paenibacillus]MBY9077305.1 polysaccharide deacetylase family sporulation protein PdaB [Paenibacillus sp. CGMCC 1.18879]MBY9083352.1 polysaccharide deacetylase family sporulation protein PdaB [Paenibacillus sinensis]
MNSFYVFSGRKIKRFFYLFAAALLTAGIVYVERGNITVFSESSPSAIYSVPTEKKLIALTFDISWGEKRPGPILKVLEDKKVTKATFFLSSPWSKTHQDIVTQIKTAGYEIGSHGHKHVNYSTLSNEEIRNQITTAGSILSDLTGQQPKLIRMPNGDFDKRVLQVATDLGYKVIQWDTDSLDWKNIGVENIVKRVTTKAHPGDIVLLHASDSCKQTHEALPQIIDELRRQGYEFVTVSELISQGSADGKEVRDSAWLDDRLEDAAGL